jgi:glyoxylase-like metal-dependent hydrolase (beta-lactamase superfamily II)
MSGPATQPPVLATVRVQMYQVGFGDCFLLRFEYAGQAEPARHILIDFGTRQLAAGLNLADVAGEIDARTSGGPDVVVLSHRHQDHMSGFGGSGTDAVVGRWKPRLVVRSCARVSTRAARSRTRCPRRSPPPRAACAPTSAS